MWSDTDLLLLLLDGVVFLDLADVLVPLDLQLDLGSLG